MTENDFFAKRQDSIQSLFSSAVRNHQAGDFSRAERLYRQVLALAPRHADCMHLLGVLACQVGRQDLGVEWIGNAINIADDIAQYHFNLGKAMQEIGKRDSAIASFRRALVLDPGDTEALFNLARVLQDSGQLDEAISCYRKATSLDNATPEAFGNLALALEKKGELDEAVEYWLKAIELAPNDAEQHTSLGTVFLKLDRLDEAVACHRKAIELNPDFPGAQTNLGNALDRLDRLDEAVACHRKAVDLQPDFAEPHTNLGNALERLGRLDEAVACHSRAVDLGPDFAEPHTNLGNVLEKLGRLDEAAACFRKAIDLMPDFADPHTCLGNILERLGRLDEAVACHRKAIELKPDFPAAQTNLGNALERLGRLDEAIACHRTAIALKPDFAQGHWNLALALLLRGEYVEGWKEYEWRWRLDEGTTERMRSFSRPQWNGERSEGRTILLWGEQGIGDSIQFVRYVRSLLALGWRIIVEVPGAIKRLFAEIDGVFVIARGEAFPYFDFHCPLLSLPRVFGTTVENIPAEHCYLSANPDLLAAWRRELQSVGVGQGSAHQVRVGLVWAGRPTFRSDSARSPRLGTVLPLLNNKDVLFVGLQVGDGRRDLDGRQMPSNFIDIGHRVNDFADTAAIITDLDLVITSDTAVAHLGAALGRPVWLILSSPPAWQWLLDRDDSPWYPTMRLFRQNCPGNWQSVLDAVGSELAIFSENNRK